MVGPVTNAAGNEARVTTTYRTYGELLSYAASRHGTLGQRFDIPVVTMFCAAMRREVYEAVGGLEEEFEVGMFEDDDYARRVRAAGLRVLCAEDVFVHHFGEASFGKLVPTGQYGAIFLGNRQRFEAKWSTPWPDHGRRVDPNYDELVFNIQRQAGGVLPGDAIVLVVSRGDETLLQLHGRRGWHFLQTEDGTYAGHHPADSREAIEQCEALRARGAQYLLLPHTQRWWLDYYLEFAADLARRHTLVWESDACRIYGLRGG
jgi:hypothetical protein